MNLTFQSPVIFVKDIEVSKNFYTRFLNQEVEHDFGNNIMFKSSLSLWQISTGHEIEALAGSNANGNTSELYFETDSIMEMYERISSAGVKFLHPVKTEPWGQMTFRFFDPDGHLVEIGEALITFISRIYQETASIGETSRRTGVPEETIEKMLR